MSALFLLARLRGNGCASTRVFTTSATTTRLTILVVLIAVLTTDRIVAGENSSSSSSGGDVDSRVTAFNMALGRGLIEFWAWLINPITAVVALMVVMVELTRHGVLQTALSDFITTGSSDPRHTDHTAAAASAIITTATTTTTNINSSEDNNLSSGIGGGRGAVMNRLFSEDTPEMIERRRQRQAERSLATTPGASPALLRSLSDAEITDNRIRAVANNTGTASNSSSTAASDSNGNSSNIWQVWPAVYGRDEAEVFSRRATRAGLQELQAQAKSRNMDQFARVKSPAMTSFVYHNSPHVSQSARKLHSRIDWTQVSHYHH